MRIPQLKSSVWWAGGIAAAVTLWVASGVLTSSGEKPMAVGLAGAQDAAAGELPLVRVRTVRAADRTAELVIRGRTRAERRVEVKAETAGRVERIAAEKGQAVKAGDPLCELDVGAKAAMLDQAKARLRQAELELDAARTLAAKGNRAATQVAAAVAAFEAAQADVRAMEQELSRTRIAAPFDGVVDDRMVEIGDYVQAGATCALVIDADPFKIVGGATERDVGLISVGDRGAARLVTGEQVEGKVTFVARSADPATRTFRVELEVPNPDFKLRDGVTAEMRVGVRSIPSVEVPPSILALNDRGDVGVKIVVEGRVRFTPVQIVGDGERGLWVAGMPAEAQLIVVGQDYVKDGDAVRAVVEESVTAAKDGQAS